MWQRYHYKNIINFDVFHKFHVFQKCLYVFYNYLCVCIYVLGISRDHHWQQQGWLGARAIHISKANREVDQKEDLHTN